VRDYIHVVDLAKGHLAAFKVFNKFGFHAFNLGTGTGTSVLEIVDAFRKESGQEIKTEFAPRRDGDVAWMWCSPGFLVIKQWYFTPFLAKAKEELGWEATQNVNKMCADLWRFQRLNPQGYADNNND